ncbi:NB-ARC domain-containing protein [Actinoplanes oblitus]|uniref:NB-ARC domain-containing protein n=1 Tax=Actinoplanes oblitus TaxID=3040509 RepID=A0ABY8WA40_9ACTN|nr:NB-ARC domain-containing protein [Actinoplanes oblitus]WIM92595.1 NB-ARC domain-containing protein [Actinoplanes oblitus]
MPLPADPATTPDTVFTTLPDPGQARSHADLADRLRRLKVWAGNPSYDTIKDRINTAWTADGRPARERVCKSTVAYCFRRGRSRLDTDLVVAVIQALHPDTGYVTRWRQALRAVDGEIEAVSQVTVHDRLPPEPPGFTGRTAELDRLRHAARAGTATPVAAIEGMAGIGKTRLAVHAGHALHREQPFERTLFVDLRGFDPDPARRPADPSVVLAGFLRLLGMPGQLIPHGLERRAALCRDRLAGTRALIVLDNAATPAQAHTLLPAATSGCLTLVTSRHSLADLRPATHLSMKVFTPAEALAFLTRTVAGVPVGADPRAAARIAHRCGYLPLALTLVTAHIHGTRGWTLTDHADRLDERHHARRLDTGVELAFSVSDQRLRADQQRLLRLLALHPGPDFTARAAAALAGTDLTTARAGLDTLHRNHLLQQATPGRYTFHHLVRTFAAQSAHDEVRPAERRAALTRLFDHYLATTAAALNARHSRDPAADHRLTAPDPLLSTTKT